MVTNFGIGELFLHTRHSSCQFLFCNGCAFGDVLSEIVRQLFFYVVTGEFLSAQYKENLRKLLKPLAAIAAVGILTVVGAKTMEIVAESRCSSNLGEFALYKDGNCGCTYGYELHNNVCISNDEACEKKLGKYSIYDGGICRCLTNYSELNDVYVFTNDICTQQFGDNAHAVPGLDKCACDDGYVWNENRDKCIKFVLPPLTEKQKCEKQGFKAKFNIMNNTCECTYNYVKINGICQDAPYCGQNAHYEEGKKCVCDSSYKREGSECVDPGCSVNSTYDAEDDKCYCKDGYVVRNGLCKSAIEVCGIFGKYNASNGNCVECGPGYEVQGRDCV